MKASPDPVLLHLRKGEVHRLSGGLGRGIAVFEGLIWLTVDGDPRDTFIAAGESHDFERDGGVVVQALAPSALLPYGGPRRELVARAVEQRAVRGSAYELELAARQARAAAMGRLAARALRALVAGAARASRALRRTPLRTATARAGTAARANSPWKVAGHGAGA